MQLGISSVEDHHTNVTKEWVFIILCYSKLSLFQHRQVVYPFADKFVHCSFLLLKVEISIMALSSEAELLHIHL